MTVNKELAAAVLNAKAAVLNARISGMVAENMMRASDGAAMAYVEADFQAVLRDSGINEELFDILLGGG